MVKDRKFNEFVDNIQKVLNKSDLVDYLPIKDSDVWQATKELEQKEYFALKKSASHYYFKGLRFIREKLDENNVQVSESYLDNCYFKFIDQEKRKKENLKENCKSFLDELLSINLKHFRYLIPISHFDYKKDMDFGKIKVVKLTDAKFEQYFPCERDRSSIQNVKKLIDGNETDIFAIVDIKSVEEKYAEENAFQLVKKFIYGIKLLDPDTFVQVRRYIRNEIFEHLVIKTDRGISDHLHSHNIEGRITPDNEFYEKFQSYWDELVTFLFIDELNEIQEIILSALYWYGETDYNLDSNVKQFINLITGLEIIVLHYSDRRKKAVPFGKKCAKIFSRNEKYWKFWEAYYHKRNDIVHQKVVDIYKEEIDTLRINLRSILLQLIEYSKTYDNLKDVFKQEFGITS